MKIYKKQEFNPLCIELESSKDVKTLWAVFTMVKNYGLDMSLGVHKVETLYGVDIGQIEKMVNQILYMLNREVV